MTRRPRTGELYRHFKNKLYQIVAIAKHSESGEELVIYQALYGDYEVYARPLDMFVSEVDHEKYKDVTQQYRFELVERSSLSQEKDAAPQQEEVLQQEVNPRQEEKTRQSQTEDATGADPRLLAFLDADTYQQKYKLLDGMEHDITDRLINDFSVILDVMIPEGELEDRYQQLKRCVATMCRYETNRLR